MPVTILVMNFVHDLVDKEPAQTARFPFFEEPTGFFGGKGRWIKCSTRIYYSDRQIIFRGLAGNLDAVVLIFPVVPMFNDIGTPLINCHTTIIYGSLIQSRRLRR